MHINHCVINHCVNTNHRCVIPPEIPLTLMPYHYVNEAMSMTHRYVNTRNPIGTNFPFEYGCHISEIGCYIFQ